MALTACTDRRRVERILISCRGVTLNGVTSHAEHCPRSREVTRNEARWHRASYRESDQTYLSAQCSGLQSSIAAAIAIWKKSGAPGEPDASRAAIVDAAPNGVRSFADVRAVWTAWGRVRARSRADMDIARAARDERWRLSKEAGEKPGITRRAARNRSWGKYAAAAARKSTQWKVTRCRWPECGQLVRYMPSQWSRTMQRAMHGPCAREVGRSDDMKSYFVDRWDGRKRGLTAAQAIGDKSIGPPRIPAAPAGRDDESMTRDFKLAIRHYLGGIPLEVLGSETDTGMSGPGVSKAVRRAMALLPDASKVSATSDFGRLVAALRRAESARVDIRLRRDSRLRRRVGH